MLDYEKQLWDEGKTVICGVDEVGRGCLFGDVVAAAVILPHHTYIEGINDSKKLTAQKREELYEIIRQKAVSIGIGKVSAAEIDKINIRQAARLAMKMAVESLHVDPEYILVDAETIDCPFPQLAIIKGDSLSQSIAAASIIAKVTRDRMCLDWDRQFPQYGIAVHKGYATKRHRDAIIQYGPSPLHRRSFLKNTLVVQEELF
jgi:ribonuclease HII